MQFPWLFLLFVGVVVGFVWFAIRSVKKLRAEFASWALAQGLTPKEGSWWKTWPSAEGVRFGRNVRVQTFTTGSGKSRITWVEVAVSGVAGRLELELVRQGFGTKIAEWFGAREVTVGDAAFDARWFVRTNREEFVRAALLPEMRARIDAVAGLGGRSLKIEAKGGVVRYVEQGGITTASMRRAEQVFPLLDELVALAEVEAAG
jgi:hypothetical protein